MKMVKLDRGVGFFNSYILQRIERNKNFLAVITGQTGSGKSWSALREGEVLDPDFDVGNVCFTPKEFLDLVNGKTKELKKGSVIIFDEIQVSMSHLDYQSIQAKLLNYVLQTFRHKCFILFVTSPHFSFINASARKLFHSRIETVSINQSNKQCLLKPFLLQTNQETGDVYRKYLRVWSKKTGLVPLKSLRVGKPSDSLIREYEEKKTRFTKELNESISRDLKRIDKTEEKPLTAYQEEIVKLLKDGFIIPQIAGNLNKPMQNIYKSIELIKKKGLTIKPIKEGSKVVRYHIEGYKP